MRVKIIPFLVSAVMVINPITVFAGGFSGGAHNSFSWSSRSHASYYSHTYSNIGTTSNTYHSGSGSSSGGASSQSNENTYHSGYKSPSANVTSQPKQNRTQSLKRIQQHQQHLKSPVDFYHTRQHLVLVH
jgi:hypothetical protein